MTPEQPQPNEFNPELGRKLRDTAIKRVRQHANPAWMAAAISAVERVARLQPRFSTEDAKRIMEPGYYTHELRAWGAVMKHIQQELVAAPEPGHKPAERGVSHRRPLRMWRSLIYWRTLAGNK